MDGKGVSDKQGVHAELAQHLQCIAHGPIVPDGSSPKLQLEGMPSSSNNSGASSHQMMPPAPPLLSTKEPVQAPLPPRDECAHSLSPVGGLNVEECRGCLQEEVGSS